jgi:hypothetical protein
MSMAMIQSLFSAFSRDTTYSVFRSGPLKATLMILRGVGIRPRYLPSGRQPARSRRGARPRQTCCHRRCRALEAGAALQLHELALIGQRAIFLDIEYRERGSVRDKEALFIVAQHNAVGGQTTPFGSA